MYLHTRVVLCTLYERIRILSLYTIHFTVWKYNHVISLSLNEDFSKITKLCDNTTSMAVFPNLYRQTLSYEHLYIFYRPYHVLLDPLLFMQNFSQRPLERRLFTVASNLVMPLRRRRWDTLFYKKLKINYEYFVLVCT